MTEYVTLPELKQHLNVDFDDDDDYIKSLIIPVQLEIEAYLNNPIEDYVTDGNIDRRIWHAIRIEVADFYANRESVTFAKPEILSTVVRLLQPLKRYR
ncbi:head-tail connector protein [Phocaeicola sp.]